MIELPEATTLADQLNRNVKGKEIVKVVAAYSPHKFAWYHGNPNNYHSLLKGKIINEALRAGGMVEIKADNAVIVLSDGVNLRYYKDKEQLPNKHQLLIQFDDSSLLIASIQMYGGILCFKEGECDSKYYAIAKSKPSPLSNKFSEQYFDNIISAADMQNKSAKFLLATEQRIPGLGNGVLQDILFTAKIHPKRKIVTLSKKEKYDLFHSVKAVLKEMTDKGGRDTERDLHGNSGSYVTKLSKNTVGKPCGHCGLLIKKESYMGGAIYYCTKCQELK